MLFEHVEYMAEKINNSILEVEGAGLCYTQGGGILFFEDILEKKVRYGIENREINAYNWLIGRQLKAPQLGYCQFGKKAVYVSRVPARIWKVGLSKNNCKGRLFHNYTVEQIGMRLKVLKDKKYPRWEKAVDMVRESGYSSVAISKRYALHSGGTLLFMDNSMGKLSGGKFVFDTQDEMDFHRNNIASLGVDVPMEVKARKKARVLNPEEEDV